MILLHSNLISDEQRKNYLHPEAANRKRRKKYIGIERKNWTGYTRNEKKKTKSMCCDNDAAPVAKYPTIFPLRSFIYRDDGTFMSFKLSSWDLS
jgi:hypothetical protein